ncbi:long-chain fatty acid CoA ligase [Kwoniella heveanensis BCC8398]|uniref:Long-chain fatty acid CoA ligase n=1 Tax=Kwoniella heveanensis BCC8398 TaxID=1296120 RepID=A0A1B9H1B9_9TREE|nr:long-chain fatty acid CoA ligase [Kwoniella heveanensis BCC8398]
MAHKPSISECDRIITAPGSVLEMEEKLLHGRRVRTWKHLPPTFRTFLLSSLNQYRDREFLSSPLPISKPLRRSGKAVELSASSSSASGAALNDAREVVSYGEVLERSLRLASWMTKRGLGVGSRVMIGGRNCTGFIVAFVATHLIGGVTIFLNAWLPREQLIWSIRMTTPSLVLVDEDRAEVLGPYQHVRETGLPDMFCWSESSHMQTLSEVFNTPTDVRSILDGDTVQGLHPESDAVIFFSSGTSGFPKAVLSTQRMAISNLWSGMVAPARAALRAGIPIPPLPKASDPQRTLLLAIPLFHVTGCLSWLMRAFFAGSKMVLMRRWDTAEAIRLIRSENVRIIGGVPAVVNAIMQSPLLPASQTFDTVFYGGAPPSKQMANEVKTRWPKTGLVQGYGLTETNAYVCSVAGADYLEKPDSTGPPVPICDLKIVDPETRKSLPQGETGLLLIKGPQVMKCYFGDEAATRKAIDEDGWLDSGDVGYLDEDGSLFIKDRLKDIIIRGGENITSSEVENALYALPYVSEAAALPLPHPRLGEVVGAVVSLRPGFIHKKNSPSLSSSSSSIALSSESAVERPIASSSSSVPQSRSDATPTSTLKPTPIPASHTKTATHVVNEQRVLRDLRTGMGGPMPRYAVPEMIMVFSEPLPKNVNGKILKKDLKAIIIAEWERRRQPANNATSNRVLVDIPLKAKL